MEKIEIDGAKVVKAYGKFLVAIYFMYMVFLAMILKGDAILDWIEDKINWVKSKFKKSDEGSGWMDV